ncbi:hypothetical protein [Microvirga pudoricolor]|uniref:hypothetical protein n=1 Tax=Microvirga pudoricolor TaxID=2778729 RepID=UPI001951F61F|nr:hypothetical protein [Microvirga pudoricolor]MBM6595345.1 hypothetical protein [Microvirga pudoricolor]
MTNSVRACVRNKRIQHYAVKNLGLARGPSDVSIRAYFAQKDLQASRFWMHDLLERAYPLAFPGGVPSHLTANDRNRRLIEQMKKLIDHRAASEGEDEVSEPSPATLRRFWSERRRKNASQGSKVK